MADLSEVSEALVSVIAQAVYPCGTDQPSVTQRAVRIFPGWPESQQLEQDLAQQVVQVSVFPRAQEQSSIPVSASWEPLTISEPTLTATVKGETVTLSGTATAAQTVIVIADKTDVAYQCQVNETLEHIAQALAQKLQAKRPATADGSCLTIPHVYRLEACISTAGIRLRMLGYRTKSFQITVWAADFKQRESIASVIDLALARHFRLSLPDDTVALLRYRSSIDNDDFQTQRLYRRDLFFDVSYALTEAASDVTMMSPVIRTDVIS